MKRVLVSLLYIYINVVYSKAKNCDQLGTLLYEDLGCTPIIKEGKSWPIKYKCNFDVKNNTCIFRGRSLKVSEQLSDEDTYGACQIGCRCDKKDKFECDELDCPEWLDDIQPECYFEYELGKCCSSRQICPTKPKYVEKCWVDGEEKKEGQKFEPKGTCLECICHKNYKGKNEAPFCRKKMCIAEVKNSEEIHKYCAPHYEGEGETELCCPDGWVCPSGEVKALPPNSKENITSDLTCQFGNKTLKLGEKLEGQYIWYDGVVRKSECECILPPLLTCRRPKQTSTNIK